MHPRHLLIAALLSAAATTAFADAPPPPAEFARAAAALVAERVPNAEGPGMAVLVKRGDTFIYRGARGMASVELGVPLSPQHVFRIGSVTKQFSAAGLLKLVDEGKVSLDDLLSKHLPDYPGGDAVTVAQLLNHTSGIKSYTGIAGYMDQEIRRDLDTAALVAVFKDIEPDFAPGEDWSYNNSGYVLVGAVIEAASGMAWDAYVDQALFEPLGLARTQGGATFEVIPMHASGYSMAPDGSFDVARPLSMSQPHAAGALVSTVAELVAWNEALHGGKVLSAESYRRMTTPEGKAMEPGYGYGIATVTVRGRHALEHGGGINGFLSDLLYIPSEQLSVAVLRNADGPGSNPGQLARELAAMAIGDPYPAAVPIDVPAAELEALQGVYRKDADTARTLRMVDGKLTSQRSGGPPFALIPIARDSFRFPDSLSYLVIERNAEGEPAAMRFFAEGEGEGEVWPLSDEPLPTRAKIELPREQLERFVGVYRGEQLQMHVFFDEADVLRIQIPGQPAFQLYAETPSLLYITEVDASFAFSPDQGQAQQVLLMQGPAKIELTRVAE